MEGKNKPYLIDTHAHLASSKFEGEIDSILARAAEARVDQIVSIACDIEDSRENMELASRYDAVAPTAGIHPLYVHEVNDSTWETDLAELAARPETAAIGEIGLDYFHSPARGYSDSEWKSRQLSIFEAQLQLSLELKLPVVIHQRNSAEDVTAVLKQFPGVKAVLHCFTGTTREAEAFLEMGHLLSYTGIITFPKAPEVREAAAMTPRDRIMVETDCPYLAPVPNRGKRCEPGMVPHIAAELASVMKVDIDEVARITTDNAMQFFRLPERG